MRKATSAEDIRCLASRLREIAETTAIQEYARLMTQAALELEHRAEQIGSNGHGDASAAHHFPVVLKAVAA